jgi:diguanylate cyclase (GGDEF)-like protein
MSVTTAQTPRAARRLLRLLAWPRRAAPASSSPPDRVVTALLGLAALIVAAGGALWWSASVGIDGVERARRVDSRVAEAAEQIRYLDEVLTHSAARFAATGDRRWKVRYDEAVGQLDTAIATCRDLAGPEATRPLDAVDAANQRLIALETRIFDLGAQGHLAEAQRTLLGEYEVQKAVYRAGLEQFVAERRSQTENALESQHRTLVFNRLVALALVALLLASVAGLARVYRRQSAVVRRQSRRLADLAHTDPLTGLANRRAALALLEGLLAEARQGRPGSVMFIDLDGFKTVNDTFGHLAGDSVLAETAHRLRDAVGAAGQVTRLGGDEFLVVVDGTHEQAVDLAERCLEALQRPIALDVETLRLSASIGVATGGDGPADELLQDADVAATWAKTHGKGQVRTFDTSMRQLVADQRRDEDELRAALAAGELEVHYQPIVQVDPHRVPDFVVTGAEALVRWRRPDGTLVPPDVFVPLAEASWLIVELDRFVLGTALGRLAEWSALGLGLHLSVNVSGRHVMHGDLVADVRDALDRYRVDPRRLTVELTETQVLTDLPRAAAVLAGVRALGVRVALDDFVTGHSALAHVTALPADIIKIDRSFVAAIGGYREHLLIEYLLRLADLTGLEAIAEGVETVDQMTALAELGCGTAQGFLFSAALPADDFVDWLSARPAVPRAAADVVPRQATSPASRPTP